MPRIAPVASPETGAPPQVRAHLGMRIGRVARLLRQGHERAALRVGLTPAQMHALSVVRYNEGQNQRGIAEILDIGEVTAGRLIGRLEALGWVERRPDPHDGRVMRVYLGPGATDVLKTLDGIALSQEVEALAGMARADVAHLLQCLDRISSNLGRPVDASLTGPNA